MDRAVNDDPRFAHNMLTPPASATIATPVKNMDRRSVTAMCTLLISLTILLFQGTVAASEVSCSYPGHGSNAMTNITATPVRPGTVAGYSCDPGYELFGNRERKCLRNGTWSGFLPVCATNVARHRHVKQVSEFIDDQDLEVTQNILDGYFSTCSAAKNTNFSPSMWVVDLLQEHTVSYVQVVFGEPIRDVVFEVFYGVTMDKRQAIPLPADSPLGFHSVFVDSASGGKEMTSYDLWLQHPVEARYISIRIAPYYQKNRLLLCEISVYSVIASPPDRCRLSRDGQVPVAVLDSRCYSFHKFDRLRWSESRMKCLSIKGNLTNSISATKNDFLRSTLRSIFSEGISDDSFWIGARMLREHHESSTAALWRWTNGSLINHFFWADQTNTPLPVDLAAACLAMAGSSNWMWKSQKCHYSQPYICEFNLPQCGTPEQKPMTFMDVIAFSIGSEAKYWCPEGYLLVGPVVRQCQASGNWTEYAPTCEHVDCGSAEEMINGTLIYIHGSTTFGNMVEYDCSISGQELFGVRTRTCLKDGRWSGSIPYCAESIPTAEKFVSMMSLEVVLSIALGTLLIMILITGITFMIIYRKKSEVDKPLIQENNKAEMKNFLARFDSEEGLDEPPEKTIKNSGVYLGYETRHG